MAIKSLFNGAILYCSRADVKEAVRGELKRVGVSKIETAANYDEAVEKINQNASFLLVIDWDQNPLDAVKILESTRTDQKIDSRPILLIAKGMSTQIVAAAYEYNVSQAHSGEVSQKIIAELLREIAKQEENNAPLRKVFQRISQLKSVKEWDTAISILEEMLNRLPQNDRVAVELAEIYIAQNQWQQAKNLVAAYIDRSPPNVRILHIMGRCLMQEGDFEGSAEVLSKAKMMNPYNAERLIDLGYSLLGLDRVAEAKANFREARSIDPENMNARKGHGQAMLLEGDINQALSLLKTITNHQELASLFNMSAVLSMRKGRFKEGMELYDSALKAINEGEDKILAMLLFNKGTGFRRWKKPDEALKWFQKAVDLFPEYEKAKRSFTEVATMLGKDVPDKYKPTSDNMGGNDALIAEEQVFSQNSVSSLSSLSLGAGGFNSAWEGDDFEDEGIDVL